MLGSCSKFLDVVPDNVPVIDQAFNLRVMAERYLVTCYSRLPSSTNIGSNVGFLGSDEFWLNSTSTFDSFTYPAWYIARGEQNPNSPLVDLWGSNGRGAYWQGINDCNIFIERIGSVPDMQEYEKRQWAAEAKFLKAYYHYLLLRAYGPIIIKDSNTPVYADPSESHVPRASVDECFSYIVKTIDEAMPDLMDVEEDPALQIGRVTQLAAKAVKAEILVQAASPLFNGNTDMAALTGETGNPLFNQVYNSNKWTIAADACKEAIDFAHANGKQLQIWTPPASGFTVNGPNTAYQMNLIQAISESDQNTEALWYDSENIADRTFQGLFTPRGFHPNTTNNFSGVRSIMGATLNMAEKFYSKNGVPIEEDKTYPYGTRYALATVPNTDAYRYDLQAGYTTINFHLNREPRFYGTLSMDGGRIVLLSERSDANALNTNYKASGNISYNGAEYLSTGYAVKKYINVQNNYGNSNTIAARQYILPFIRLGDLYLLYAEALNESQGPVSDVYTYVDRVRQRSGLKGVVESWTNYSSNPAKPASKEGMRAIIKRERTIELAFEGKRFWDLRRWKDARIELNKTISGWDYTQRTSETFYRPVSLFSRTFTVKDYFWPISLDELRRNTKLKQNPGW
jgi:hypothetical protein